MEADYYVFVDGDDTFSAEHFRQLLEPVMEDHADMAVGYRLGEYKKNLLNCSISLAPIWYKNLLTRFIKIK